MTRLVVIGGGRMGAALVQGIVAGGRDPATVTVVERDADRRAALAGQLPGIGLADEPPGSDGALVAVKPSDAEAACRSLAQSGTPRVLSIMAGISLQALGRWLPASSVLRAMPNTPSLVGAGISALCAAPGVPEADLDWAEGLLRAAGTVVRLPESSFDAVTGLSGSGPAYVFLVAEALEEAGVLAGLPRPVSRQLAAHTIAGAGRLLVQPGAEPSVLRADVTSPGGTTAAGLRALESHAVRAALLDAVTAAAERSRQLAPPPA